MPRAATVKPYNTLLKGLVTEAGPLNFPEGASYDELNVDLDRKGLRHRRLGFDLETSSVLSTETVASISSSLKTGCFLWTSVAEDPSLNFLVVQMGSTLTFHDIGSEPISAKKRVFTINLNSYLFSGYSTAAGELVTTACGRGCLFISSAAIKPLVVSYSKTTKTITVLTTRLIVRDLEGVDDGYTNEERPSSLTALVRYNLVNNGWPQSNITRYYSERGVYPNKAEIFHTGYVPAVSENGQQVGRNWESTLIKSIVFGNTPAPRGKLFYEIFDRSVNLWTPDRTGAYISGVTSPKLTKSCEAVGFFSGRIWYGLEGGRLLFSQLLDDDLKNRGYCFQSGDPTSEPAYSDIIATDGGYIKIAEAGDIKAIFPYNSQLIVFASNGIWSLSSSDSGFTATDYAVKKISSIGIIGKSTLIDVEGSPVWWGTNGIYTLAVDQTSLDIGVKDLTIDSISSYYNEDITPDEKQSCTGAYDQLTKRLRWVYGSGKILTLDAAVGAFIPWALESLTGGLAYLTGITSYPLFNTLTVAVNVIDSLSNNVIDSSGNQVIGSSESQVSIAEGREGFIYMCLVKSSGVYKYTFGLFKDTAFKDWKSVDTTGKYFSSYMETGWIMNDDTARFVQAPYIHVHAENVTNPGATLTAKWEWTNSSSTYRWSTPQAIYRLASTNYPVTIAKLKIRGKGRTLQLKFESEQGKDFGIYGWSVYWTGNQGV